MNKRFFDFISVFRLAIHSKRTSFSVFSNKFIKSVCEILLREGRISSFYVKNGILTITISYYFGNSIIKEIELLSTASKKLSIKLVDLSKFNRSSGQLYIISTIFGLKTLEECILLGIGGFLVLSIK